MDQSQTGANSRDGDRISLFGEDAGKRIRWQFVDIRPTTFAWQGYSQEDDGAWRLAAEFQLTRMV
jgi:hypothetical protein